MNTRKLWLQQRIKDIVDHLGKIEYTGDWKKYVNEAHDAGCELMYATTEWEKCYKE